MESRAEEVNNSLNVQECDLIQALIEIKAVHADTVDFCNCRVCQIARRALNGILAHC